MYRLEREREDDKKRRKRDPHYFFAGVRLDSYELINLFFFYLVYIALLKMLFFFLVVVVVKSRQSSHIFFFFFFYKIEWRYSRCAKYFEKNKKTNDIILNILVGTFVLITTECV